MKIFSSSPITRYSVGRFQFDNAILDFNKDGYTEEDQAEFLKIVESMPPVEQHRIQEIRVEEAHSFVRGLLANQVKATQVTDSSHGRPEAEIGTTRLEDQLGLTDTGIGEPLDPHVSGKVGNNPIGGEEPAGSGDLDSGENHGAGNMATAGGVKTPEELAAEQAKEVTDLNQEGQDLVRDAGLPTKSEDSDNVTDELAKSNEFGDNPPSETEVPAASTKPKLGGLNLGRSAE